MGLLSNKFSDPDENVWGTIGAVTRMATKITTFPTKTCITNNNAEMTLSLNLSREIAGKPWMDLPIMVSVTMEDGLLRIT